jgi:competence protein ComEC
MNCVTINYKLLILLFFYIAGVICAPLFTLWRAAAFAAAAAAALAVIKFLVYKGGAGCARLAKIDGRLWLLFLAFFSCALLRAELIINDNSKDINKKLGDGAFVKLAGRLGRVKINDKTPYGRSSSSAVIAVEKYYDARLKTYKKINGSVFIKINGDRVSAGQPAGAILSENDLIEVAGRVKKIHKYKNLYLSSNYNPLKPEILYSIDAEGAGVNVIKKGSNIIGGLKNKAVALFKSYFPADISGFLIAFALGDSSETADSIYFNNDPVFDFCESGLLHIMVVSGGHVTLMIVFISSALNFLKIRPEINALILFIIVSLYFLIIGFQAAVTRAYISFAVYIAASCLEREINQLNIFIAAMFAHIIIFPEFIFSPGFWLSYISTFAIIAACAYKIELFKERIYLNAFLQYCKISAAALISTYPAVCHIAGYFPLNSIAANILTLWIYEALLALCLIFAAVSLISTTLAWAAAAAVYHTAFAALKINEFISFLPMGNLAIYKLTLTETLALYLIIAGVIYTFAVKKATVSRGALLKIAACALIILTLRGGAIKYFEGAEAIFLDTGQGDCALVKTAGNKWIIIDAGGSASSYNKVLAPYLRYRHISEIEYLIITHAHSDHYCNAVNLYANRKIKIKTLYYSPCDKGEAGFNKLLSLAYNKKTIYAGGRLFADEISIDILWPPADWPSNEAPPDCNDSSIVAAVKIKDRSILFCGDITQKVENKLIKKLSRYNFDFVKAPHHGSITSNSEEFIKAAGARGVYIPSAASNKFGHPHKKVLNRYDEADYKIYNSQNCGGIILNISKRIKINGYNFSGEYL